MVSRHLRFVLPILVSLLLSSVEELARDDRGPLTVVVLVHGLEVGAPVALGGGGIRSGARLERIVQDAPAQCRHDETFYVQSVSEAKAG